MSFIGFFRDSISLALLNRSRRQQMASQLRDPMHWGLEVNDKGHLAVQGIDTEALVSRFGSPLLAVNRHRLVKDATAVLEAFQIAPKGSRILYSYKTNCIPGILKNLHAIGIGAEVISPFELWLADKLGVPGDSILYNGVDKSEDSLELAVRKGILSTNIDYPDEIEKIYRIAERLNARANVGVRLALAGKSQFGLDIDSGEALAACKAIERLSKHLHFRCIHFNVTSNAKNAYTHKTCAIRALEFARQMQDATGLRMEYLDIGGGFGVPTTKNMNGVEYGIYRTFGALPSPPRVNEMQPLPELMKEIVDAVERTCSHLRLEVPKLLIEPGRLVTSRSEFLLASVRAVKSRADGKKFAITDAGRLSITFPCDFEYHEVFLAQRPRDRIDTCYEIKGRICTSADWMFKHRCLPRLKAGDILAVMDAGAYFSSYSSNFAFPRPAIVMVDEGKAELIRNRESFAHLVAMDDA